jgi:hypothetical protein
VFQHKTFCRFLDVSKVKIDDVLFNANYFKIHISSSKTDQAAKGESVYVAKSSSGFLDPHMLMCVYLHRMELDSTAKDSIMYLFPPLK